MRLLIDTHYLVWSATGDGRLTKPVRSLLADRANTLFVSAVSIWELRIKWNLVGARARDERLISPGEAMELAEVLGARLDALEPGDPARSLEPRPKHGDPFDEMLLVHAERLGARLLTRDRKLRRHPLAYQA